MNKKIWMVLLLAISVSAFSATGVIVKPKVTITPKIKIIPQKSKTYVLTINTNVKNSIIFIDNKVVNGNRILLPAGLHTVVVKAKGFIDYTTQINLTRNSTINTRLAPEKKVIVKPKTVQTAFVNIVITSDILNIADPNALSRIRIYDNNVLTKGFSFQTNPGNHNIRIESGGISFEANYTFMPGQNYTIEPIAYLNITQ